MAGMRPFYPTLPKARELRTQLRIRQISEETLAAKGVAGERMLVEAHRLYLDAQHEIDRLVQEDLLLKETN